MKLYANLPAIIKAKGEVFVLSTLTKEQAIEKGINYRSVYVLSWRERGVEDLHGKQYEPREHIFIKQYENTAP
jgi:hypothetical protein